MFNGKARYEIVFRLIKQVFIALLSFSGSRLTWLAWLRGPKLNFPKKPENRLYFNKILLYLKIWKVILSIYVKTKLKDFFFRWEYWPQKVAISSRDFFLSQAPTRHNNHMVIKVLKISFQSSLQKRVCGIFLIMEKINSCTSPCFKFIWNLSKVL